MVVAQDKLMGIIVKDLRILYPDVTHSIILILSIAPTTMILVLNVKVDYFSALYNIKYCYDKIYTCYQSSVSMVASDWQVPLTTIKEELKCVLITHGEQFVQTTGTIMTPLLPVASLDLIAQV